MDDKVFQLLHQMSEDIGHLKGTSEATLEEARKTNGRLRRAEDDIAELRQFQTKVKTYGTIGGMLIGLISSFFTRLL